MIIEGNKQKDGAISDPIFTLRELNIGLFFKV